MNSLILSIFLFLAIPTPANTGDMVKIEKIKNFYMVKVEFRVKDLDGCIEKEVIISKLKAAFKGIFDCAGNTIGDDLIVIYEGD